MRTSQSTKAFWNDVLKCMLCLVLFMFFVLIARPTRAYADNDENAESSVTVEETVTQETETPAEGGSGTGGSGGGTDTGGSDTGGGEDNAGSEDTKSDDDDSGGGGGGDDDSKTGTPEGKKNNTDSNNSDSNTSSNNEQGSSGNDSAVSSSGGDGSGSIGGEEELTYGQLINGNAEQYQQAVKMREEATANNAGVAIMSISDDEDLDGGISTQSTSRYAEAMALLQEMTQTSCSDTTFANNLALYKEIYNNPANGISEEDMADLPDPTYISRPRLNNKLYQTDIYFKMAYYDKGNGVVDIIGNLNGMWIQTTYNYNGYQFKYEDSGTSGNATLTDYNVEFVNGGAYIKISYSITATKNISSDYRVGAYADIMIGGEDYAPITVMENDTGSEQTELEDRVNGIQMVNKTSSKSGYGGVFTMYFRDVSGTEGFDQLWFGKYSASADYWKSWADVATDSITDEKANKDGTLTGTDSGMCTTINLKGMNVGDVKTASFIVGVGSAGKEPAWQRDADPVLELRTEFQQVYVTAHMIDETDLSGKENQWDKLYYSIDGKDEKKLASIKIVNNTNRPVDDLLTSDEMLLTLEGSFSVTGLTPGEHVLRFWVMNTAGMLSTERDVTITIFEDGRLYEEETCSRHEGEDHDTKHIKHTHEFSYYLTDENVINQYCICGISKATLTAENNTYTGSEIQTAKVAYTDGWNAEGVNGDFGETYSITLDAASKTYILNNSAVSGGTLSYEDNIDAGTASVSYVDPQATDTNTARTTFEIYKKDVTAVISWGNTEKDYDGNVDQYGTAATASIDGIADVDRDVVTISTESHYDSKDASDTRTITATVSLGGSSKKDNYNLVKSEFNTDGKITKKELSASVVPTGDEISKEYDGNTTATGAEISLEGMVDGESVSATATAYNYADKNAGENKQVVATGVALVADEISKNYTVASNATGTGKITKRILNPTLVLGQSSKTYDGYDTVEGSISITLDRVVNNEVTASCDNANVHYNSAHVNATEVKATGITLSDETNYELNHDYATASGTITARVVTPSVYVENTEKTYDGNTEVLVEKCVNLSNVATPDIGAIGAEARDGYAYNSPNVSQANTIKASGIVITGDEYGDYVLEDGKNSAEIGGTIVALKVTPSLNVDILSKTYDGTKNVNENATTSITLSQVIGQDTIAAETGSILYNSKNHNDATEIIAKNITLINNPYGNYELETNEAKVTGATIEQKELTPTLVLNQPNKTYNGNTDVEGTKSITLRDVVPGDSVSAIINGEVYYNSKNVLEAERVTAEGIELVNDNGNYYLSSDSATAEGSISAKTISASVVSAVDGQEISKIYDGNEYVEDGDAEIALNGVEDVDAGLVTAIADSYTYSDKNAATGKTITANGVSLSGVSTFARSRADVTDMSTNYVLDGAAVTGTGAIEQRTVYATVVKADGTDGAVTKTYDGTTDVKANSAKIKLTNVVEGENLVATTDLKNYSYNSAEVSDAYTITATNLVLSDAVNYKLDNTSATGAGKIFDKAADLPTGDDAPKAIEPLTYNGEYQTLVEAGNTDEGTILYCVTTSPTLNGTEDFSAELPQAKDAGTYYVFYKVSGGTNFADSEVCDTPIQVVIDRKEITNDDVTVDKTDLVYNSEEQEETVTVDVAGVTGDITYDLTGNKQTNASNSYTLTVTGTGNFKGTVTKTWAIEQATLTPNVEAEQTNKIYDGTTNVEGSKSIRLDGIQGNDGVYATADFAYNDANVNDADTIIASNITLHDDNGNYKLSDTRAETDGTISRRKLDPSMVVNQPSKSYDGTTDVEGDPSIALDNIANNDGVYATADFAYNSPEVNDAHTITASNITLHDDNGNYYIDVNQLSCDGNINKASASTGTLPTVIPGLIYNSQEQTLIVGGHSDDGTMVYSLSEDGEFTEELPVGINAGDYPVYYKVIGDDNHEDTAVSSITGNIAPLNIFNGDNGNSAEVTLVNELTYNGHEQEQLVSIKVGDVVVDQYSISNNKQTNAGDYVLTITGTGNFVGEITKEWSIAKSHLTITVDDVEQNFGDEDPEQFTVSTTGLADTDELSDVVSIVFVRSTERNGDPYTLDESIGEEAGDRVGTYDIIPTVTDLNNPNYIVDTNVANGLLTIKPYAAGREIYTVTEDNGDIVTRWVTDETRVHVKRIDFAQVDEAASAAAGDVEYIYPGDAYTYTYTLVDRDLRSGETEFTLLKEFADGSPDEFYEIDIDGYDGADYHYQLKGFNPSIIEGADPVNDFTNPSPLTFYSNDVITNFLMVKVNGAPLDRQYYTVSAVDPEGYEMYLLRPEDYNNEAGYIKVTIDPEYLTTLSYGTVTVEIVSTNGSARSLIHPVDRVIEYYPGTYTPKTGDESNMALYIVMMLLSGMGAAGTITVVAKKKEQ